jgi:chaperonin GroEL (HSP60 family)
LDPVDLLLELRARHEKGEKWAGVDVFVGKIKDMRALEVYEPLAVKKQTIKSAAEAATLILRVDDVIASGRMKAPPMPPGGMPGGGYGGMPPEY